ncbi:unnamed protein product [Gongylonema pulchrum]|uniref:LITAF domain-containing protein n=1 Tax=Gongylonema pulchrum TaxID=637853 RepID=A0A183CZ44_9BILA|nr:unnamed protein product [Gongylonema pulchrum]
MTEAAKMGTSPPPAYSPPQPSGPGLTTTPQQPKPVPYRGQPYDLPVSVNPSTPSPLQPVIMPMMVPQATALPMPYPPASDKPVNIVVNANAGGAGDVLPCDCRICCFCRRGVMERKKLVPVLFASLNAVLSYLQVFSRKQLIIRQKGKGSNLFAFRNWWRVFTILVVCMLFPPVSFLCCCLLCTRLIYIYQCSACGRVSKRQPR